MSKRNKNTGNRRREIHGRAWCVAWSQAVQRYAAAAGLVVETVRDHGASFYLVLRDRLRGYFVVRISTHPSQTFRPRPSEPQKCFEIVGWKNAAGLNALRAITGRRVTWSDLVCVLPHARPVHE